MAGIDKLTAIVMKISRLIFIAFIIVSCQTRTTSVENSDAKNASKTVAYIHGIDTVFGDKLHISIKEFSQTGDTFATGLTGHSKIENVEVGLRSKKNKYKLNVSDKGEIEYQWVSVDTYAFIVIMNNKDSITFSARLEPLKYNLVIEPLKENNSR